MYDFPIATYALMAATVAVSLAGFRNHALFDRFAFEVGPIVRRGQAERMLTSSFLHVDTNHLFMNMLTLFFFGPALEFRYGPVNFVCLYIFCAIAADLAVLLLRKNQLQYRAVGASDAVSGVLGAYCVLYPFNEIYILFLPIGIPAILYAVVYLAWSSWAARTEMGNVAHDAHIAGTLAGAGAIVAASSGLFTGG